MPGLNVAPPLSNNSRRWREWHGLLLAILQNRMYVEIPAATDLRTPLTDRRTLSLPLLSIRMVGIWEGAPKGAWALVLAECVIFSKFGGMPKAPSSLISFAAKGEFSISSARIMSAAQRASLSVSILAAAPGDGLSPTNHLVACRSMWSLSVFSLVSARGPILGMCALARSRRGIDVVGAKDIRGCD